MKPFSPVAAWSLPREPRRLDARSARLVPGYVMTDLTVLVAATVIGSLGQTIIAEPVVLQFSSWWTGGRSRAPPCRCC